jgi:ketosteroid isomerase-like protein
MDPNAARLFAKSWIAQWNAGSLEAILAMYADDVTVVSPLAASVMGGAGYVTGKQDVRTFWSKTLNAGGQATRFVLLGVGVGINGICVRYLGQGDREVYETLQFGPDRRIWRSEVHFAA